MNPLLYTNAKERLIDVIRALVDEADDKAEAWATVMVATASVTGDILAVRAEAGFTDDVGREQAIAELQAVLRRRASLATEDDAGGEFDFRTLLTTKPKRKARRAAVRAATRREASLPDQLTRSATFAFTRGLGYGLARMLFRRGR